MSSRTSADTVGEGEAAADEAMTGTTSGTTTDDAEPTGSTAVLIEEILAELEANGFCDPDDVEGTGDIGITTAMHFVIEAQSRNHRAPARRTTVSTRHGPTWQAIAASRLPRRHQPARPEYEACEGCDTLAFVSPLDDAGTFFLMAIDVTAAQDDPDELSLTPAARAVTRVHPGSGDPARRRGASERLYDVPQRQRLSEGVVVPLELDDPVLGARRAGRAG